MPETEATPTRDRLMLLDGHSLAYRAFYALKEANLVTTDGQHTEAVYGFTSMLVNLLRDEGPSHIVVCFDRSEPTFRHESFQAYKANRQETPEDFRGQMSLIFEMLDSLRVPHLSLAGFEADDLIATLAIRAAAQGMSVLIVSGDRDNLQLVNDDITVLMTRRGISDMTRFTPEAVIEKYGLTPIQYPDFAALRGDPSDNLPSIPGVGEKTAAKWVREFGSLAELVDRVDEVKGKAGDKLREHLGQVIHNRQLTELRRDVPLDVDIADLKRGAFDRDGVHKLFDSLQFRGELRDRLFKVLGGGQAEPEAGAGFEVEVTALGPGEVGAWLDA
ncbi:MAG TPA: 5'-3' exonuclease H3TH domain-containing protein, partial [Thermopolyspora sp.]